MISLKETGRRMVERCFGKKKKAGISDVRSRLLSDKTASGALGSEIGSAPTRQSSPFTAGIILPNDDASNTVPYTQDKESNMLVVNYKGAQKYDVRNGITEDIDASDVASSSKAKENKCKNSLLPMTTEQVVGGKVSTVKLKKFRPKEDSDFSLINPQRLKKKVFEPYQTSAGLRACANIRAFEKQSQLFP